MSKSQPRSPSRPSTSRPSTPPPHPQTQEQHEPDPLMQAVFDQMGLLDPIDAARIAAPIIQELGILDPATWWGGAEQFGVEVLARARARENRRAWDLQLRRLYGSHPHLFPDLLMAYVLRMSAVTMASSPESRAIRV